MIHSLPASVLLVFLVLSSGVSLGGNCFCKAMCFYTDAQSSDFSLSQDVPCDLPLGCKKALFESKLKEHLIEVHGDKIELEKNKKIEIKCFEAKAQKS